MSDQPPSAAGENHGQANHGPFGPPPTGPPLVGQAPPAGHAPAPPSYPQPQPQPHPQPHPPTQPHAPAGAPIAPAYPVAPGPPTGATTGPAAYQPHVGYPPPPVDRRPWWGMGDILLSLPFIIMMAILGTVVGLVFVSFDSIEAIASGESTDLPIAVLASGLLAQQAGQGVWPFIVSKWKGLGPVRDWRLRFEPADLWIGPLTGFGMLILAGGVGFVVTELVGLDDEEAANNTAFLNDAEGTPWLFVFIFAVVVGAPVVEELFFRGLCLRAIEKRMGIVSAVIGSTIIFTLPHFIGGGWKGTAVLFSVIGLVGAVLGVLVAKLDRLGPAIIAHMVFNTVGVLGALGVIEEPEDAIGGVINALVSFAGASM